MHIKLQQWSIVLALVFQTLGTVWAREAGAPGNASSRMAAAPESRQAYYGDLHLHTAYSLDAYILFGTKVTPDMAYRFAKGEPVSFMGQTVRRRFPLDFLAVTDHSERMGVLNALDDPSSALAKSKFGQQLQAAKGKELMGYVAGIMTRGLSADIPGFDMAAASSSVWEKEIEAANQNYRPGKFTTFIAYEWSSTPKINNLHRNIIFSGDHAPPPFSALDSERPEDLWAYLDANREKGVEALAIPHNGDASGGLMYDWVDSNGKEIDQGYAQQRALNEPLTEIVQTKGQSETHPMLSPNDELANFEIFDHLLVGNTKTAPSRPPGSYIRDAYGRGLEIERRVGANPYKYGVVGATDFHNGLTTSDENSVFPPINGGIDPTQPFPTSRSNINEGGVETMDVGSGALTGVWAEENTRKSIYAALRRKETFATSGPRLKFRIFGGWQFDQAALQSDDWIQRGYRNGVPMGGDLPARPDGAKAPSFMIRAAKDPDGANLDRLQIIKVWLKNGKHTERVFDVAYAGRRKPDAKTGKLAPIGDTVDLKTASYKNSIGATALSTVWQDPEFDPKAPAVYYLRVVEIPTPRWSTILAVKQGQSLPNAVPATIQERGWSSPIWYTPRKPNNQLNLSR